MHELLSSAYPWTKAFHVVSIVAWMAGLFYLPRIFVYHAERAQTGSEMAETFKTMEAKLLRAIMNPAMAATYLFGIALVATPGVVNWSTDLWIYGKLALVALLTWFHHWCARRRKDFVAEANKFSGRHYRMMNEVPTLALVGIVILVIVKPF